MTGVFIKRTPCEETDPGQKNVLGRWSCTATSQDATKSSGEDPEQILPQALQREHGPVDTLISHSGLTTVKQLSVVLSHPVCGTVSQQPWETSSRGQGRGFEWVGEGSVLWH